jgi:hypothetical protein
MTGPGLAGTFLSNTVQLGAMLYQLWLSTELRSLLALLIEPK